MISLHPVKEGDRWQGVLTINQEKDLALLCPKGCGYGKGTAHHSLEVHQSVGWWLEHELGAANGSTEPSRDEPTLELGENR